MLLNDSNTVASQRQWMLGELGEDPKNRKSLNDMVLAIQPRDAGKQYFRKK